MNKQTARWQWPALFLFLLGLVIVFGPVGVYQSKRLAPPRNARTLEEFRTRMPPPQKVLIAATSDGPAIVWVGELAAFPALPSGPAAYRFDGNGQLVEWCSDINEGHPLGDLVRGGKEIPLAEAIEVVHGAR